MTPTNKKQTDRQVYWRESRIAYVSTLLLSTLVFIAIWTCYPFVHTKHVMIARSCQIISSLILVSLTTFILSQLKKVRKYETTLREREREFTAIFEKLEVGIAQVDAISMKITRVNQAFSTLTGYSPEELSHLTLQDLTHPDDHAQTNGVFDSLRARTINKWHYEKRYVRKDGSIIWVNVSGNVLSYDEDPILRCIGVAQDVTERRNAEIALQVSEERLRLALTSADIGIYDYNLNSEVLSWDERSQKIFANPPNTTPGIDTFLQTIHPKDRDRVSEIINKALNSKMGEPHCVEYRHVLLENETEPRWIRTMGRVVFDENSMPYRCIGTVQDITQHKKAEEERSLALAKFKALYDVNLIGVLIADEQKIIEANDFYLNPINFSREELKEGKVLWREITPSESHSIDNHCLELLKTQGFCPIYEKEYFRRDGSRVPVLIGAALLPGPEQQIVAYVIDISKQKATEEQLKSTSLEMKLAREQADAANKAKSEFLATMSHEIRTPLNAIVGFTDLLIHTKLPAEEREDFASRIQRNGELLVHLIDDILDLSKIEAGKLQLELVEMNLQEMLKDIVSLMKFKADNQGIAFFLEEKGLIPETILCDPTRFKQILTNIIGNAIKFTSEGQVQVQIQTSLTFEHLHIVVQDTGVGLTSEQIARLFKPFTQADNSTTRKYGGTGLGLILSQRLAEALGGTVHLRESTPGQGSTFEIILPLKGAKYKIPPAEVHKSSQGNSSPFQGLRILLAEDLPDNQFLVKKMLTMLGASAVEIAQDGEEALKKANKSLFDVILMDIRMPKKSGIEATQELRRAGNRVPIIALTAHAMQEEVTAFLAAGCNEHLAKPIRKDDLINVIERILQK